MPDKAITIDRKGYVSLICKDKDGDSVKLLVSSTMLSWASPVFKAMLTPHFKEGITLSSAAAVEIPLPEDDADTMSILCYIFHLRQDVVPSRLEVEHVMRLAVKCDYYDCCSAVTGLAEKWIRSLLPEVKDVGRLNLLEAAFLFRHDALATEVGVEMALHSRYPLEAAEEYKSRVPKSALVQIELAQARVYLQITSAVQSQINKYLSQHTANKKCTGSCTVGAARTTHLLVQLQGAGLLPIDPFAVHTSVAGLLSALSSFEIEDPDDLQGCEAGKDRVVHREGLEVCGAWFNGWPGWIRKEVKEMLDLH